MHHYDEILGHFHLTISGITAEQLQDAAELTGLKATSIDLLTGPERGVVKDRMLTGYCIGSNAQSYIAGAIKMLKRSRNLTVCRSKLELSLFDYMLKVGLPSFTEGRYVEVHVKMEHGEAKQALMDHPGIFVTSRNPTLDDKTFLNYRAYNERQLAFILGFTHGRQEVHYEYCVYDSNKDHDAHWWNLKR